MVNVWIVNHLLPYRVLVDHWKGFYSAQSWFGCLSAKVLGLASFCTFNRWWLCCNGQMGLGSQPREDRNYNRAFRSKSPVIIPRLVSTTQRGPNAELRDLLTHHYAISSLVRRTQWDHRHRYCFEAQRSHDLHCCNNREYRLSENLPLNAPYW